MGFGTSLMLLMTVQEIGRKHGISVEGEAADLGTYKGKACDIIMASAEIAKQIQSEKPVIGVSNLLDKAGIERSILPYLR
jgi:PTS system ascorbate-specific IIB component